MATSTSAAAAASSPWRRFDFYQPTPIRDADDFGTPPRSFVGPNSNSTTAMAAYGKEISAVLSSRFTPAGLPAPQQGQQQQQQQKNTASSSQGCVLVAFTTGRIDVLDSKTYRTQASFYAYGQAPLRLEPESSARTGARVTHMSTDAYGRLVTVGEQADVRFPLLKIWDLLSCTATEGSWGPRLLAETRVQHGTRPTPVACITHTPNLGFLSLGLADGTVLLMREVQDALKKITTHTEAPRHAPVENGIARSQQPAAGTSRGAASQAATTRSPASAAKPPAVPRATTPQTLATLPKFKVILQQASSEKETPLEPLTGLGLSVVASKGASGKSAKPDAAAVQGPVNGTGGKSAPVEARARGRQAGGGYDLRGAAKRQASHDPSRPTAGGGGAASGSSAAAGAVAIAPGQQQLQQSSPTVHLFIVTPTRILRYTVLGPGAGMSPSVVDDVGCALGCAAVVPASANVISGGSGDAVVALMAATGPESVEASAFASLSGKVILARDEAIYVAGADGREACYALEGAKSQVLLVADQNAYSGSTAGDGGTAVGAAAASHHLLLLSPPTPVAPADSAGAATATGTTTAGDAARLTIFDLDSKIVVYSASFSGGIRHVWVDSASEASSSTARICILTDEGQLVRLEEKTIRNKLDMLFAKGLFLLALSVAKSYQQALWQAGGAGAASVAAQAVAAERARAIDPILANIHRRYAEHLYTKADYDGAVKQFVKTIGWTQPSYVIRRFLDAQRITNLTVYLQELHARGLANSDHTTLLLNCYTKLKDVAALDAFIRQSSHHPTTKAAAADDSREDGDAESDVDGDDISAEREQLPFDLDTAIRVCRQGGFYSQASYLAKRYEVHDEYMRIQVEDTQNYDDALLSIRESTPAQAEKMLKEYARVLLTNLPEATTTLLIELCSGHFRKGFIPNSLPSEEKQSAQANKATSAAQYLSSYLHVANYLRSDRQPVSPTGERGPKIPTVEYDPPTPTIFFAHFARHTREFMLFLESVALLRWGQQVDMEAPPPLSRGASNRDLLAGADLEETLAYESEDTKAQRAIWNTLLELYLGSPEDGAKDERSITTRRKKALRLLEQSASLPYDVTRALLLCSMHSFAEGQVYLFERLGLFEDIINFWIARSTQQQQAGGDDGEAHAKLIDALDAFGRSNPELYPIVLRHLVSSEAFIAQRAKDAMRILQHIEQHKLMSPLEVVQTLAHTPAASVGLVRDYLVRAIVDEREEIDSDLRLIESYRSETAKKQAEVAALTDEDQPRVFQVTICSSCGGQLDLPSVHFMCKHSYHHRCLVENENECPTCARAHTTVRDIRRANQRAAEHHDLFLEEVHAAEDGFGATARMFSKGLLSLQAPS